MPGTTKSGRRVTGDDNFPIDGLPSRPVGWGKEQSQVWTHLMSKIPAELLRSVDAYQLTTLCELIVRQTKLAKVCSDDPTDLHTMRAHIQTVQQVAKLSTMYGLSPIDRRRIKLESMKEEESVFDELLARMSGSS